MITMSIQLNNSTVLVSLNIQVHTFVLELFPVTCSKVFQQPVRQKAFKFSIRDTCKSSIKNKTTLYLNPPDCNPGNCPSRQAIYYKFPVWEAWTGNFLA